VILGRRDFTLLAAGAFSPESWEHRDPESLGMRTESLHQLAGALGGRGCVIRQG
jgi:hypothetical protein